MYFWKLKLKLPILWPPDAKNWFIWKGPERLRAGGEGDNRGWDGWWHHHRRDVWIWVISRSWWWTGKPGMLQSMGSQSQIRLSDWIKLNCTSGWCYMGQLTFCFAKWTNYIAQFLTYDLELVMWKFTHRWKNMTPFSFHAHIIEWVTAFYCISKKKF